jgi:hypothetical protein
MVHWFRAAAEQQACPILLIDCMDALVNTALSVDAVFLRRNRSWPQVQAQLSQMAGPMARLWGDAKSGVSAKLQESFKEAVKASRVKGAKLDSDVRKRYLYGR